MNHIIRLTGFLKPYSVRITGSVLLATGTILAGIGLLASSGYLISAAALRPPILDLMVVIVAVRFFGISRAALRYGERLLSHDITFRLLMRLRGNFFAMIRSLPASVLAGFRSGTLLSSITSDVDELQNYYIRVLTPMITALVVSLIAVIFLYQYSPPAALFTLFLLTINATGVPLFVRRVSRGIGRLQVSLRGKLQQLWVQHIQGMEEIRLFGLKDRKFREAEQITRKIAQLERCQSLITGLQDTLFQWIMWGAVFIALLTTSPIIMEGVLPGVFLALVLLAVMASFEAVQNLGTAFQYLESTEKAAENLQELAIQGEQAEESMKCGDQPEGNIKTWNQAEESMKSVKKPEDNMKTGNQVDESIKSREKTNEPAGQGLLPELPVSMNADDIEFRNVGFAYDVPIVLNGFNAVIRSGSHTAIVGPTGCGKSTLVNLLLQFYRPDEGQILLGNVNLRQMAGEEVRGLISVVDQHTYVFNDTLRNNLTAAKPAAGDEELWNVLNTAGLSLWAGLLSGGLNTMLGEHGKSMSGGERQRLALARGLLKNAGIWILDEPTANLDAQTEWKLIRTLRSRTKDNTVVWITHRFVDMEYYDQILVMKKGRVVESGDHARLMQQSGWYSTMYKLQCDQLAADSV